MSSDWKEVTIEDVTTLVTKGTTPTSIGGSFSESGIPFVKVESISESGRLIPEKFAFIDTSTDQLLARSRIQQDDVLFSIAGTIGRVALVNREHGQMNTNQAVALVRPDTSQIEPRFLYYSLRDSTRIQVAQSRVVQSVQANFSLGELKQLQVDLPPKAEQKAIAHILGTLDDKIELNRKTNETLEAMAKALFKSWFVDFDPVRAKAEGRPTGLPAEISDLFPDSFEDSELGEIPSGWKCLPLADRAIYLSRGISPAYCEEGGILVLNQKCIRDSRVSFEKARRNDTTKKQVVGREVKRFDALVNSTGVGTLGRVAMMPTCEEEVVVDSHVTVVRGGNEQESFFISSALLNRQSEIEALGEGSTGQTELSRVVLGSMPVIFPSSQLINTYFDTVYEIQDRIEKNEQAIVSLASTRDALLPKLISGEIRIPDAEKMLDEVDV